MTIASLIKKYPDVDPSILKNYKEADTEIIYHENDPDLHEQRVKLPKPPEPHKILNFGLPAEQQKWHPPKLPHKLLRLIKRVKDLEEIWKLLQNDQTYYKDEISFIKEQWYYLLHGRWFYNNGKPVYLDGWHWFYLSWWNLNVGKAKYRLRDWMFFHFARFCFTDTTSLYNYKVSYNGEDKYFAYEENIKKFCELKKIPESEILRGEYIVDTHNRVCFGFNYPKYRREGATYKAGCINYCMAIVTKGRRCGIQANRNTTAKRVYLKSVVNPWRKLPFFFKPITTGSSNPQNALVFDTETEKSGNIVEQDTGLETMIDYEMSEANGYDGEELQFHHHDEVGKPSKGVNMVEVSDVVKECLAIGSKIHGLGIKTSTVGLMDRGGGDKFQEYCNSSMWHQRDENGQTGSGFYNLFISSDICYPGFIDQYGNPVLEKPEKPVLGEEGNWITQGSRNYILNKRQGLLNKENWSGWVSYVQKFPLTFAECFTVNPKGTSINKHVIIKRMQELNFNNPELRRGTLYRIGGPLTDTDVEFAPDPEGRFYVSYLPPPHLRNKKFYNKDIESWEPENNTFVAGGDPFKQRKVQDEVKGSKGGGAVYYPHDPLFDVADDPKDYQISERFVVTYATREAQDPKLYAEDMLMMCELWGAKMFPEINVPILWDYFVDRGRAGYLLYAIDRKTGKFKSTPGATTGNNSTAQELFTEYVKWSNRHAFKEDQMPLLQEISKISGIDEMTKYDLFTAGGFALMGAKILKDINRGMPDEKEEINIESFFKKYKSN